MNRQFKSLAHVEYGAWFCAAILCLLTYIQYGVCYGTVCLLATILILLRIYL